ncbi:LysR substrate-binding domain-containing protein [Alcaligenes endophyticus]|uniref:LysR family transcriptional regulator n=1 Tax=Alcaligenes endophyticus TaxID=1929088 RepID=A0ABT8EEL7_9BURK|nr:LysR substrate-binding domain-containing protein [Alcaligenes endophyticus]MCX5592284.1 LysR substrate-binding domain-containing protein [Alcaligenes endophyticus]MDN4119726.1 LysR family transcriptional regulator [Alcaligenes endophyticus]
MHALPPLRAVEIFETLGHSQSLQEAAQRLQITPGAVSQQLKLLEQEVGTSLTYREGKRLRLTAAGTRYHQLCTQAFELLREAQQEMERARNTSMLSISAVPSLLKTWVAPLIFEWQEQHDPLLTLHLKGSHAEPDLEAEHIDFRITYGQTGLRSSNHTELYTDLVVPACSPQLLGSLGSLQHPRDILNYPLLSSDWQPRFTSPPSWREWFEAALVSLDAQPLDSFRIFSLSHMAIDAAVAGQGFVLAQCSMIQQELAQGKLILPFSLALPLPWPYVLSWRSGSFENPSSRQFHRWLLSRGRFQATANQSMLQQAQCRWPLT